MEDSIDKVISISKDITIGEKKYKLKSLGVRGLGEFHLFCNEIYRKEYILCCTLSGEDTPSKEKLMELSANEKYLTKIMNTIEGCLHLIYIVIKYSNKDMDIDEDYIKDNLNIEEVNKLSVDILGDLKKEPKPVKNVKARPRKKKKNR